MVDFQEEKLQFLAQKNYDLDLQGALRKATGLTKFDVPGILRHLFGNKDKNAWFAEAQAILSNRALLLPGVSGSYLSTPDVAALDIIGDIDIRVEFIVDPDVVGNVVLLSKWTETTQRSYRHYVNQAFGGLPTLEWSSTGANSFADNEVAGSTPFQPKALKATLDVDNLAGGRDIAHFKASTIDGTYTQIGSTTTQAGITSIFSGSGILTLGATNAGTESFFKGRITRMELRNGINGTVVANPDMRALAPGTTSFTDGTGKLWTLNGGAAIV